MALFTTYKKSLTSRRSLGQLHIKSRSAPHTNNLKFIIMAKFKQGILGGFSGKVGSVIGGT